MQRWNCKVNATNQEFHWSNKEQQTILQLCASGFTEVIVHSVVQKCEFLILGDPVPFQTSERLLSKETRRGIHSKCELRYLATVEILVSFPNFTRRWETDGY